MEWYLKVWRNYANFDGRARRKEYWMFALIHILIVIFLYSLMIAGIGGSTMSITTAASGVLGLYILAVLIPGLAVAVRRLHDIGKSGWMLLVYFIPLAGPIWLLVMLASDGTPGPNKYGGNPKELGGGDNISHHLVDEVL